MRSLDAPEPAPVETLLDAYFFRPVASLVARVALPAPLPLIGVTLISIVVGLSGASLLRFQVPGLLVSAALLLVLYGILDAAEVELARARHTSPSALHGASQYVVGVASAVTIAMNLSVDGGAAGASVAVLGMGSALLQVALSGMFGRRHLERAARSAAGYEETLAPVALGWAYLGPSTHVALLAVFLCAGSPAAYVWLRLTLGNVALALLYLVQRQRERALDAPPPPAEALPGPPVAVAAPPPPPAPSPEPERKGPAPISFRPPPLDE